jgi:ferric-dicitrate binding protein FerR (iron transport regulator)
MVMLFTVDPATQDTLSVMLSAGMRGRLPENSMQPEILEEAVPDRLFWLDGTLEFRQTGLQEVVRVLSEQFGVVIRADRPEILNCRLSATFRNESLETILEVISASFGLEVRKEGNGWVFYGKGC